MSEAKLKDIIFRDIDLKFTKHPITNQLVTLKNDAAVIRSMKNLILTRRYEYFYRPEIHSNVLDSLFELGSHEFAVEDIRRSVRDVITKFEQRVELIDVIARDNLDSNGYDITVIFRSINTKEPTSFTLFLERLR